MFVVSMDLYYVLLYEQATASSPETQHCEKTTQQNYLKTTHIIVFNMFFIVDTKHFQNKLNLKNYLPFLLKI